MRFHASHERACRTAKRLRDAANAHLGAERPVLLSDAQRALAAAWGYASWTELLQGCEDAPRSPFDKDADASVAAGRAEAHADALASSFGIHLPLARAVVADAGLTARTPPSRPARVDAVRVAHVGGGAAVPKGVLLGHDATTGEEIRLPLARARRHLLLCGGDAKGRASLGLALTMQRIADGTACIHVDAGMDGVAAYARVSAAARAAGRADDVTVLDLRGGEARTHGSRHAPALNPYATGDAESLVRFTRELAGSPYDTDDWSGDWSRDRIWAGRTVHMLRCVMPALVFLRDERLLDLDAGSVRDHLDIRRMIDLVDVGKYPEMPHGIRERLRGWLDSLPGFLWEKGHRQAQMVLDNHDILGMAFTFPLMQLADAHGDVFGHVRPDADDARRRLNIADLVSRRGILLVMLPEKGEPWHREVSGRVVVALLQRAMRRLSGEEPNAGPEAAMRRRTPGKGLACAVHLDGFDAYGMSRIGPTATILRWLEWSLTFSMQGDADVDDHAGSTFGQVGDAVGATVVIGAAAALASALAAMGADPDPLSRRPEEDEAHLLAGNDPIRTVKLVG